MIDVIELAKIIAEAIKNNEKLNKDHYVFELDGHILMYNPVTFEPCLTIMRKIDGGDRKEFHIAITKANAN